MITWSPEELTYVPCDYCATDKAALEYKRADGMRVVECAVCGLAYLNPRPIDRLIGRFYEEHYFTGLSRKSNEIGIDVHSYRSILRKPHRAIEIIEERYFKLEGKNVLEIGCASGDLMIGVREKGATVKGLEISKYASGLARKRSLEVITGTVEDITDQCEIYDVVIALELIEHVTSPTDFFSNVSGLLKHDGILLLSTPNYSGVSRHGNEWAGFNYSFEHIYFFNPEILRRIGAVNNFAMDYYETSFDTTGPPYGLSFIYRQLNKLSIIFTLSKEIGLQNTMRRIFKHHSLYWPYGQGRTITAVFKKITAGAICPG